MLGLGWTEMLVIAVVALIFVGPKDLPVMLRQVGRAFGTIRRMGNEFQREFNKMAAMDDIRDVRKSLTDPLRNARAEIEREFAKGQTSITPAPKPVGGEIAAVKTAGAITDVSSDAAKASMTAAMQKAQATLAGKPDGVPTELVAQNIAGPAAAPPAKAKPDSKSTRKPPAKAAPADSKPAAAVEAKPVVAKTAAKPEAAAKKATKSGSTAKPRAEARPKPSAKAVGATGPAQVTSAEVTAPTNAKPARKPAVAKTAPAEMPESAASDSASVSSPVKPTRRRAAAKTAKA